jgi:hypothetical protein
MPNTVHTGTKQLQNFRYHRQTSVLLIKSTFPTQFSTAKFTDYGLNLEKNIVVSHQVHLQDTKCSLYMKWFSKAHVLGKHPLLGPGTDIQYLQNFKTELSLIWDNHCYQASSYPVNEHTPLLQPSHTMSQLFSYQFKTGKGTSYHTKQYGKCTKPAEDHV